MTKTMEQYLEESRTELTNFRRIDRMKVCNKMNPNCIVKSCCTVLCEEFQIYLNRNWFSMNRNEILED